MLKFTKIKLSGLSDVVMRVRNVPSADRYILKAADGLGPPPITVSVGAIAVGGGIYQGRRASNRQLTFRIGLNPRYKDSEQYGDLRTEIYGMLTPPQDKDWVDIQLLDEDDNVVVSTQGWVSKCEDVLFSKDPEVQVVIDCITPFWNGPREYVPIVDSTQFTIVNKGTAPSGFHLAMTFIGAINQWGLYKSPGYVGQYILLSPKVADQFAIGNTLVVETEPGSRAITRNGTGNLIYSMGDDDIWPGLYGGINKFYTYLGAAFVFDEISYVPKYWGV